MARKKKIKDGEELKKEASSLSYRGTVSVKLKQNGKIILNKNAKNTGTSFLLRALTYCLCGDDVSNEMPKYLDAGVMSNGQFISSLSSRSTLTQALPSKDGEAWKATFQAMILYSQIKEGSRSTEITALRLCSNQSGEDGELAVMEISTPITIQDSSYVAMVEWNMYIENAQITTGGNR